MSLLAGDEPKAEGGEVTPPNTRYPGVRVNGEKARRREKKKFFDSADWVKSGESEQGLKSPTACGDQLQQQVSSGSALVDDDET